MISIVIVDKNGVEKSKNDVTEAISRSVLEDAARVTCEIWNRDHPNDKWGKLVVNDEEQ